VEKIYQETDEKSGTYKTNSPCVQVTAWRPTDDELGYLPAIIVLSSGILYGYGEVRLEHDKYLFEPWRYDKAQLIRKAIKRFDSFKRRVYRLAKDD
jgi:hypothetical protein